MSNLEPGIIHFLKTCDISILENALVYRNETMDQSFKDWICRKNLEIRSVFEKPKLRAIEVEIADNEFFFKSKKYKSLLQAAKDNGISNNSALKYALDNGRHFVKRRSYKKNILCEACLIHFQWKRIIFLFIQENYKARIDSFQILPIL